MVHHSRPRIATSALNPILALYQTSMYSVWPIVDADDLVSRLDDKGDLYNYALALATAAATPGQLKASASLPGQCPPADLCEAECQRVRYVLQCRDDEPNITWLRVAFFLHAYHENRLRGCTKSLLYLRKAISLAHLMDLHGESLDQHIPIDQLCLRKRMFWLLFVTERGNSVFHRLPVQLLPVTQPLSDDIAPDSGGFEPLEIITRIFMAIDRSGLCYTSSKARQNSNEIMDQLGAFDCTLSWALSSLQNVNDIHKADVFVTVCWARVMLWKATQPAVNDVQAAWNWWVSPPCYLLNAAEEMISSLQALPSGSIGAHGVGIQVKIFDIASALIEHTFGVSYTNDGLSVPTDNRSLVALKKLHDILATIKNGHQEIISRLFEQVIDATPHGLTAPISFTWKTWKHIWDRVDDPAIMDGTNLSEFTSNLQSRALGVGPLEQIEME
ncbi:hypothetical protein BKA60DRAFT_566627 [Fusarium oxysporum]|nr:hypothetical protein BKA60DRAFT_566627 [Fusarium oxysporum]